MVRGRTYEGLMKTVYLPVILFPFAALLPALAGEASSPSPSPTVAAESHAPAVVMQSDDDAGLQSKVGSEVVVEGVVKGVGKTLGDGITFLNFGERKTGFVAVVFRSSYDKFPEGFDKYANQKIRVRGTLEKFKDRQIQIRVVTPDQIEIVPGAP